MKGGIARFGAGKEGVVISEFSRTSRVADPRAVDVASEQTLPAGHKSRTSKTKAAIEDRIYDHNGYATGRRQLRHKSFNRTAGYIREGRLFKGSSASLALR